MELAVGEHGTGRAAREVEPRTLERGYVITGKELYLEPYNRGAKQLVDDVQRLRLLTADNPRPQARLEDLQQAIDPRVTLARQIVAVRKEQGFDAAQRLFEIDVPRQQTDRLRAILREVEGEEHTLLQSRERERQSALRAFWSIIGARIVGLIAALAALWGLIWRSQRREKSLQDIASSCSPRASSTMPSSCWTSRVTSWGAGAQRIKGYRADEIIGHHFSVFYPPEDIANGKPQRELEEAAATGRMEDEGWRIRKDRSRFWALVVITAIRDASGLLGFGKVTRNLTERHSADEQLRNEISERRGPPWHGSFRNASGKATRPTLRALARQASAPGGWAQSGS